MSYLIVETQIAWLRILSEIDQTESEASYCTEIKVFFVLQFLRNGAPEVAVFTRFPRTATRVEAVRADRQPPEPCANATTTMTGHVWNAVPEICVITSSR